MVLSVPEPATRTGRAETSTFSRLLASEVSWYLAASLATIVSPTPSASARPPGRPSRKGGASPSLRAWSEPVLAVNRGALGLPKWTDACSGACAHLILLRNLQGHLAQVPADAVSRIVPPVPTHACMPSLGRCGLYHSARAEQSADGCEHLLMSMS